MDGPSTWAEIDSILASIDPNRASWISQLEAAAVVAATGSAGDGRLLLGLDDWAALNQLEEEILAALLAHGFDCAGFINGVLSDADLQELGVRSGMQRRRIFAAVQELPNCAMEVAESLSGSASADYLLQRLRLNHQLGREFADAAAAATLNDLASATEAELQMRFGLHKLGHRRRVFCCLDNAQALGRLRRPHHNHHQHQQQQQQQPMMQQNGVQHGRQSSNLSARSAASSATAAAALQTSPSSSCPSCSSSDDGDHSSSLLAAASAGIANRRQGLRAAAGAAAAVKNSKATALTEVLPRRELPVFPAGGCSRSWMADGAAGGEVGGRRELSGAVGGASFDDAVLVRSRSIDCLDGDAAGLQRRRLASAASAAFRPLVSESWPHHPDVLLRDSFSYSVSYLGFRPLADHTDPTETAQVMQMFRCKSADILKLPRIRLTVCYRGVKFINPDNDMVITEHRITEIYFACQDNTRRANFAYVTKDSVNGVHYCHCFASHSPETAVLIIQTLSEACGLANQLIEFNQLRRQLQPDARRRSSRKRNKQT